MTETSIVWRVNRKPRFPLLSLGEYMVADDGPREAMRRNMKFERLAPTLIYRKLQIGVKSFLASPLRDRRILERCRDELEQERATAASPKASENALYALRALDKFESSLNALPVSGINLSYAPLYRAHAIEGVRLSIQPTVLIRVERPRGKALCGAYVIDTAKGIEPKTDEAKAKATAAMVHAAYLLHDHVARVGVADDEKASNEHCCIFHTHRQELVCAPDNYRMMLRNLEAACRDIAKAWDAIDPPAKFAATRARFRD